MSRILQRIEQEIIEATFYKVEYDTEQLQPIRSQVYNEEVPGLLNDLAALLPAFEWSIYPTGTKWVYERIASPS